MKSLRRFQLTVLLAGTACLVLSVESWRHSRFRAKVYEELDATLTTKAAALATLTEYTPWGVDVDVTDETMPEFIATEASSYFQVWMDDVSVARSISLADGDLPYNFGTSISPVALNAQLPDGRPGRVVIVQHEIELDEDLEDFQREYPEHLAELKQEMNADEHFEEIEIRRPAVIVIAASREHVESTIRENLVAAAASAVALVGLLAILIVWTVNRGLAAVRRLSEETNEIDATVVRKRLSVNNIPQELAPLSLATNRMLDRVEEALDRERSLTAGVAHELRTPLAELQSALDAIDGEADVFRDSDICVRLLRDCHEIVVGMTNMTNMLLESHQANRGVFTFEPVNLSDSLAAAIERCADLAQREVTIDVPPGVEVISHRDALAVILDNLLSNAASHSTGKKLIHISADRAPDCVKLAIANSDDSLTETDFDSLSRVFWRKDPARTDRKHFGVGLKVVHSLASSLGVEVQFELKNGMFVVHLNLPAHTHVGTVSSNGSPLSRHG